MIQHSEVSDWLRRRVGDTGPVQHWSNEYIKHAVEEAIVEVINDVPEAFTKIIDLPVNADNNTIDLPEHGVVFTRAYGVVNDGKICRTLKWTSETKITDSSACWRDGAGQPTHAVYTDDQTRVWLNGVADGAVRCSVAMLPNPLIDGDDINIPASYQNLINYWALIGMYGLTTNGAGKMQMYQGMYQSAINAKRRTNAMNPKNMTEAER